MLWRFYWSELAPTHPWIDLICTYLFPLASRILLNKMKNLMLCNLGDTNWREFPWRTDACFGGCLFAASLNVVGPHALWDKSFQVKWVADDKGFRFLVSCFILVYKVSNSPEIALFSFLLLLFHFQLGHYLPQLIRECHPELWVWRWGRGW